MSQITAQEVRDFLRLTHTSDDGLLTTLIAAATQEACRFLNRRELPTLPVDLPGEYDSNGDFIESSEQVPTSEDPIADDVRLAVYYLVQAAYEGAKPEDRAKMRSAAEVILMPYRTGLGV